MNLILYKIDLTLYKNNNEWAINLNVNHKNINLQKKSTGEKSYRYKVRQGDLRLDNKTVYKKSFNFALHKTLIKRIKKKNYKVGENICKKLNKGLVPKIYKEL